MKKDTSKVQNTESTPQAKLNLERLYVKDISFEVPQGAQTFTADWKPEYELNLTTNTQKLDNSHYQVTLTVTVKAQNSGQQAFVAEVHQSGIFLIENIPDENLAPIFGAYCPNILFPFAREAINDLVCRGSFPQLLLSPINFDAVFEENLARQKAAAATAPEEGNA